jgi:hypothetical protein
MDYVLLALFRGKARHMLQCDRCPVADTVFDLSCCFMKCFGCGNCPQIQGEPYLNQISSIRRQECRHFMQEVDQIPVIFQEEAGLPFTIALLSEDVDSAEQAIFMAPHIDDGLHNEDVDTRPVLLWIHPTVTGSLNGVPIPGPVLDPERQGGEYGFCSDARATPYPVPVVP